MHANKKIFFEMPQTTTEKKIVLGPANFYIYGNIHTYISVNRFLCAMHFLENLLKTAIFIDISRIIELQRRPKQPECHWGD